MSAQAAIEIALYSGLIPAATALAVYFALGWLLPADVAHRYRLPGAFALAVFVGFALAPTTKALAPAQFWDWIPYLGLVAAFAVGLAHTDGVTRGERWTAVALVAALAAWTVVPTWDELAPTRHVQVIALAAAIAALAILLEPLAVKLPGRAFPLWLLCTAGAAALLILAEVSETFGRLAALPASALVGCVIASWFASGVADWRTVALPYSVVAGGYAFTGFIYPSPPLTPLAIVPFVPLTLWICAWGPLGRLTGAKSFVAQAACVLLPLIVVAALLISRSAGGDEW